MKLTLPTTQNINHIALDAGALRFVISRQMEALMQSNQNADWLRWERTAAWKTLREMASPETLTRYELAWRTMYKRGNRKQWLADSIIANDGLLNFAAAWMCWAELHDDRPGTFPQWSEPNPATFGVARDESVSVVRLLLELPNWLWGSMWPRRPQLLNNEKFLTVLAPDRSPAMTRWEKDVDIRDWQACIMEGCAPGFSIVNAREWADVHTAPGADGLVAGTIIGSGDCKGTLYQRGLAGNWVNVTKHPEKLRRDLPGFNGK